MSEPLTVLEAEETLSRLATLRSARIAIPKNPKFSRADVTSAFQSAFELIGGTTRLALWANENPGEFYKLFGKLLPSATQLELSARPLSDDDLRRYTTDELRKMYEEALEEAKIINLSDFRIDGCASAQTEDYRDVE